MFKNFKTILFAFVILVIAGSAYAFAAANTVPESAAGFQATVVSGYTVTNLVYDLDDTDPTDVAAITFDIAPTSGSAAAVTVKVQTETDGTWTNCTLDGTGPSKSATCSFDGLALVDVTALNIVASSTTDPVTP